MRTKDSTALTLSKGHRSTPITFGDAPSGTRAMIDGIVTPQHDVAASQLAIALVDSAGPDLRATPIQPYAAGYLLLIVTSLLGVGG